MYLGYEGSGSYSLSGSSMLSAPSEQIGFNLEGTPVPGLFQQSGGTNSVSSSFAISDSGSYLLGGGMLQFAAGVRSAIRER